MLLYRRWHGRWYALPLLLVLCVIVPWSLYVVANRRQVDTLSSSVPLLIALTLVITHFRLGQTPARDPTQPDGSTTPPA
jgi:hypothetical protein